MFECAENLNGEVLGSTGYQYVSLADWEKRTRRNSFRNEEDSKPKAVRQSLRPWLLTAKIVCGAIAGFLLYLLLQRV